MPNGIDLILADHRMVDELFASFSATGQGAFVGQIVDALAAHDQAEHGALYPFAEALLDGAAIEKVLDRAAIAHASVKKQIDDVLSLEGDPLVKAVGVLQQLVRDHVKDEEKNLLPKLADTASAAELEILGARILQAKQRVG